MASEIEAEKHPMDSYWTHLESAIWSRSITRVSLLASRGRWFIRPIALVPFFQGARRARASWWHPGNDAQSSPAGRQGAENEPLLKNLTPGRDRTGYPGSNPSAPPSRRRCSTRCVLPGRNQIAVPDMRGPR